MQDDEDETRRKEEQVNAGVEGSEHVTAGAGASGSEEQASGSYVTTTVCYAAIFLNRDTQGRVCGASLFHIE